MIEALGGLRCHTHSIRDHTPAHEAWRGLSQTPVPGRGVKFGEHFQAANTQASLLQPVGQSQRRERLWGQQSPIYALMLTTIDTENRRKAGRNPAFRRGRFLWRLDSTLPPSQYRAWLGSWRRRICRFHNGRHTGIRPRGSARPGSRRSPRTYQNNESDSSPPPLFCSASRKPRTFSSTSPACGCTGFSVAKTNSTPRSSSRTI